MAIKRRAIMMGIVILMLIIGAAAWYGYREFSRKTESADTMKAAWILSADSLVKQFASDASRYTELYTGKVLEVSGSIMLLEGLPAGPVTVVLQSGSADGSVRMVMDSSMNTASAALKPGQQITIRGVCIGYSPDDMGLGADILFNRAVIIKN